jgi:hypothetical protein
MASLSASFASGAAKKVKPASALTNLFNANTDENPFSDGYSFFVSDLSIFNMI